MLVAYSKCALELSWNETVFKNHYINRLTRRGSRRRELPLGSDASWREILPTYLRSTT